MTFVTRYWVMALIIIVSCCLVSACSTTARLSATSGAPVAKNVILFIGDGMGVSTVTAIRILGLDKDAIRQNCASARRHNLPTALELAESAGKSTGTVRTTTTSATRQGRMVVWTLQPS